MAKSGFRNKRGEQLAMPTFTATAAKNGFGRVLEAVAERGAVAITRHDAPKAVLLSIDEYEALLARGGRALDTLTAEFDALLASMQTPRARRAMKDAFDATPGRIGKAAVAAAAATRRASKRRR
jgi:antitoxin Phd